MEVAMTTAVAAPTTAERIRSACVRAGGAMLAIEGVDPIATPVHHLLDDGSFAITVPGNGTLAGMVVAADDPNPALLQVNSDAAADTRYSLMRLEIESVVVADSTGAESVGVGALLGAEPDPFC